MQKLILLILGSLVLAGQLSAQTGQDSWDNLKQLRVGEKIEVVDMNLKSLKGTFVSYSEEAISLRAGKDEVALARANVLRVSAHGGGRAKNAFLGFALGAATGLVLGAVGDYFDDVDSSDPGANNKKIFASLVGAGAGAAVGSAFPGYRTIYRAEVRRSSPSR